MNDARYIVAMGIASGIGKMLDGGMASPEATIRELDGLREQFGDVLEADPDGDLADRMMAIRLRALEMQGHITA